MSKWSKNTSNGGATPNPLPMVADGWFRRARAACLESLPCQPGCCRCCLGPFAITLFDCHQLQNALITLAPETRRTIQDRARTQVRTIEEEFPVLAKDPWLDQWADSAQEQLAERFRDLPCPALDPNGQCRVYPFRPLTCRMMGIPIKENGLVHGACVVQDFVPITPVPHSIRQEETRIAEREAWEIQALNEKTGITGEEVFLPYGFLPDNLGLRQDPTEWAERF